MKYEVGDLLIADDVIPIRIVAHFRGRYLVIIFKKFNQKVLSITTEELLDKHCKYMPVLTGGLQ